MFQFQQILGDEFQAYRDAAQSRALNPKLQSFEAGLKANADKMTIG